MRMAMGGGMDWSKSEDLLAIAMYSPKDTPTIAEQAKQLEENINLLEDIWANDEQAKEEIDEDDWKEFMDKVYGQLEYLEGLL